VAGTLWLSPVAAVGDTPATGVAQVVQGTQEGSPYSGTLPTQGTFRIAGLSSPARVTFEANGTPHIQAESDHDYFLIVGYLHATFRLFQMDVLRRLGEGLLSEVVGAQTLASDKFEDMLGLQVLPRQSGMRSRTAVPLVRRSSSIPKA
jgi:penicillin amidase